MKTAMRAVTTAAFGQVLDQRERIRYLHYSLPTEQAYVHWVRAFIRFHGVRHPATFGAAASRGISFRLANERKVSVPRIVRHWRLAVLLRQGAVHGSALASGDRKTSAVAALAGGADPG